MGSDGPLVHLIPGCFGRYREVMHWFLAALPPAFHAVPYVGERHPGAVAADAIEDGANCQLYAYAVLRHHGISIPPVRSRELWLDHSSASRAAEPYRPFDLLLVNDTASAYGAHVGVFVSSDEVLHLCREVGVPTVWRLGDFARRERYATIVGVKRLLAAS